MKFLISIAFSIHLVSPQKAGYGISESTWAASDPSKCG